MMAWGLRRRNVLGRASRALRHYRIQVGLIGDILGEQPNLVLPRADIGSLALTYSKCHQQMLESLRDSSEEKPWIRLMSSVWSHCAASLCYNNCCITNPRRKKAVKRIRLELFAPAVSKWSLHCWQKQ